MLIDSRLMLINSLLFASSCAGIYFATKAKVGDAGRPAAISAGIGVVGILGGIFAPEPFETWSLIVATIGIWLSIGLATGWIQQALKD